MQPVNIQKESSCG